MFLHLLSAEEQHLFCDAAHQLIAADAVLHELERELQSSLARELGLDRFPEPGRGWNEVIAELRSVETAESRCVLLLELAGIACADRELHEAEASLLHEAATALSLPPAFVQEAVELAVRAHALHNDARVLIFDSPSMTQQGSSP